jgi:3-hydroxybutyryl-CoA dehydrogenase
MEINTVGVIGAGVMGSGVAHNLAQVDCKVIMLDLSETILEQSKERIENNIRFQSFFGGQKNTEKIIRNIEFTTEIELLSTVDFVIENVTEKWKVKREIYQQLDKICGGHCIFAANTSAISITKIGSLTKRPKQVLGIHFMNPVPLKEAVEVIKGYHTTDDTINTAKNLLNKMGKQSIIVNDMPGFVSNRILMLTINEAIFVLQDQVSTVENIDRIFKLCFSHKMGPLETADMIGLDTILYSLEVLYDAYNDTKFRPSPLLKKMVDAGLYGRKNGKGFYQY